MRRELLNAGGASKSRRVNILSNISNELATFSLLWYTICFNEDFGVGSLSLVVVFQVLSRFSSVGDRQLLAVAVVTA